MPPAGLVEVHWLDAGQWPGGSRAVCCVALGGSGRAGRRSLVPASGGQENGQTAHQRAGLRATGWNAGQWPGGSRAARCASLGRLWPRGWTDTWSSSGRSRERPAASRAGRMLGRGRAAPGRRAASPWAALVERVGGTWSQLRAVRRMARRADRGPPQGHRPDAWQGPDGSRAARCVSLGGPGRVDGQAPGHGSGQSEGRPDGLTVGHQRATGRMHGKGRMPPGRRGTPPWASLAERVGGTWSQLRAVRRTARRADSGPPEGHGPDAGQKPGGSSAARCVALGGSGNN